MAIEIEFDDVSLEPTLEVDSGIETKEEKTTETEVQNANVETPKKRGRPANAKPIGTETNTTTETETENVGTVAEEEESTEGTSAEDENEETLIQTMAKKIGIEIPEGTEFTDDEDGLVQFNQFVAEKIADDKLNGFFENLPPVAGDFFDYLQMLGDDVTDEKIKSFFTTVNPEIDYGAIDLEDENIQKTVLKTQLKKMGYTDEDIKAEIAEYEMSNTLKAKATRASTILAANQKTERASLLANEKAEADIKKANTQKFFAGVKEVIDSGKVNNFTIPVTERKAQLDYDLSGQFMKDLNEILKDPTQRTQLGVTIKHKWNLDKYVNAAAATQKAQGLKAKLAASSSKLKGGNTSGGVTNSEIDFEEY